MNVMQCSMGWDHVNLEFPNQEEEEAPGGVESLVEEVDLLGELASHLVALLASHWVALLASHWVALAGNHWVASVGN